MRYPTLSGERLYDAVQRHSAQPTGAISSSTIARPKRPGQACNKPCAILPLHRNGGEGGPVTFPAFKAGDPTLREPDGGFDSHTLPPEFSLLTERLR